MNYNFVSYTMFKKSHLHIYTFKKHYLFFNNVIYAFKIIYSMFRLLLFYV
jgi:hypothetical protein